MAIFTKNKVMRIPDYYDGIIRTNTHRMPFQAILKRGATPIDWTQEVQLEGATISYAMAAAEGGIWDQSKIGKRMDGTLKHELEKIRSILGWSVTDESEKMPNHNEKKGEKARAKDIRKDGEEVILSWEHIISSAQEAVERGDADDNVAKTRGLLCWLAALKCNEGETEAQAAKRIHPVHTINPKFMPRCGFEGDVKSDATFNEDVFADMLEDMANEQGDNMLSLTMLAGGKLKRKMSGWLTKVKATTGVENAYRLNLAAGTKKKSLICDIFEYDAAMVRVIRDNHLNCTLKAADSKGIQYFEHTDAAKWCGALIRPEFWAMETFTPLTNVVMPKVGDQECGYHKMIARLACRNPLAQGRIMHTA